MLSLGVLNREVKVQLQGHQVGTEGSEESQERSEREAQARGPNRNTVRC